MTAWHAKAGGGADGAAGGDARGSAWRDARGAASPPASSAADRHAAGAATPAPSLGVLERQVLARRREHIACALQSFMGPPRPAWLPPPPRPRHRALALSGGGIRSATFALGVLQAIARDRQPGGAAGPAAADTAFARSRLSCFDYLSTVSGGGYVGAFLCSLFVPNRLRSHDGRTRAQRAATQHPGMQAMLTQAWAWVMEQMPGRSPAAASRAPDPAGPAVPVPPADLPERAAAAGDAVRVLGAGPPDRIRSHRDYTQGDNILGAPLAWLRENGRYLVPTGAGDAFYAAALAIRNWLALHYVIGTVLMAAVALVGLARAEAAMAWPALAHAWEQDLLGEAAQAFKALGDASCRSEQPPASCSIGTALVWWSPLLPLALVPVVLAGVPLGVAFWLVHERDDGRSLPINIAMLCTLGIGAALLALGCWLWPDFLPGLWRSLRQGSAAMAGSAGGASLDRQGLTMGFGAMAVLSAALFAAVALVDRSATMQRVLLTRRLADVLVVTATLAGIGLVDTLGQTLYLAVSALEGAASPALAPAGLAVAISWLAKRISSAATGKERPSWFRRLPLTTLAGAAGVLVFVLIGSLWSLLVHWIVWDGAVPAPGPDFHGAAQLGTLGWVLAVTVGLGVVAGHFAAFINLSTLQAFYSSRLTRAYLGASNGARFESGRTALSAAEPLADDQLTMDAYFDAQHQEPRTLAPLHIINLTVNKTVDPAEQLVQRDRKGQPMAVLPMGFSIDEQTQVGFPQPSFVNGMRRPLPVGQWIGTSGAAFSTGIGRETSLGMSLLMGAANVRLGTWWESGLDAGTPGSMASFGNPATWLRHLLGAVFRTQTYLSYELRARFLGTHRRWQYLSDGGHFENTGLYELLRRERQVVQVFCCDAGADPKYQFDDLANLIRLARIDLRVEITVQTEFSGALAGVFGAPRDFGPRSPAAPAVAAQAAGAGAAAPAAPPTPTPCALLLWARHFEHEDRPSTQIVVIKPRVTRDVPVDICQYADVHPAFPQQTTADQFFDEAQWESYRALGYHLGGQVFTREVMEELDRLARKVTGR